MLIHGLQPVGYRSHALRIGTVATVSIRGYFSAMNEIQDGLVRRCRSGKRMWRSSLHCRQRRCYVLQRAPFGVDCQEARDHGRDVHQDATQQIPVEN